MHLPDMTIKLQIHESPLSTNMPILLVFPSYKSPYRTTYNNTTMVG